ncbi:MAG: adenosine kinase [Bacteroidales bacterium]|nr:adenosine kinase [Bacteroidales bacterium]
MKRILGIGNALADILVKIQDDTILSVYNLPKGSMQLIDYSSACEIRNALQNMPFQLVSGGSAANTICGIARMGVPASFVGKVGKDVYGNKYVADLQWHGVCPQMIVSEDMSGFCTALISLDGERTMATYLGTAADLQAKDIVPSMFENYDMVHVEGYLLQNHDLIQHIMQSAKKANMEISLDLASYNVVEDNLDFLQNMVSQYVDIVFANEEEAKAYTGKSPEEALSVIAQQCNIAVVKVGKQGSWVQQGEHILHVDVYEAQRVDTTGAGDLYAAGFLAGYAQDKAIQQCALMGSYVSSMIVEVVGAKFSEQKWQEINKRLTDL